MQNYKAYIYKDNILKQEYHEIKCYHPSCATPRQPTMNNLKTNGPRVPIFLSKVRPLLVVTRVGGYCSLSPVTFQKDDGLHKINKCWFFSVTKVLSNLLWKQLLLFQILYVDVRTFAGVNSINRKTFDQLQAKSEKK